MRALQCALIWMTLLLPPCLILASVTNTSYTSESNVIRWNRRHNTFQCFVCFWSPNEEPCGDQHFSLPPSSPGKFMINCLACYKQVLYTADGKKEKILRGCAQDLPHYALYCQQVLNQDGSFVEICACSSSYCNRAVISRPPFFLFLLLPFILLQPFLI